MATSSWIFPSAGALWWAAGAGALVLAACGFFLYRGEPLRPRRRLLLASLRALFFLALSFLLFVAPRRVVQTRDRLPARIVAVLDVSASMERTDVGGESRKAAARRAFQRVLAPELRARAELITYWLSGGVEVAGEQPPVQSNERTALLEGLGEILRRERDCEALLLFTDGQDNSALQPVEALRELARFRVPVHILAVGPEQLADLAVEQVSAPALCFPGEEVLVIASLGQQGLEGRRARVRLLQDQEMMAEAEVVLGAAIEDVKLAFHATKAGRHSLSVGVEVFGPEDRTDNNERGRELLCVDDQLRILLCESQPRWEWRFLANLLQRLPRTRGQVSTLWTHLQGLPEDAEEYREHDVVVLGDVDPGRLLTDRSGAALREYIEGDAGSVLVLPGYVHGLADHRGTPLDTLLPLQADSVPRGSAPWVTPHLLPAQQELFDISREAWQGLSAVPLVGQRIHVRRTAQVLLAGARAEGSEPLLAVQRVGRGRVACLAATETWRWRDRGDHYERFWEGLLRFLASSHLQQRQRGLQLEVFPPRIQQGEALSVRLRAPTAAPGTSRWSCRVQGEAAEQMLTLVAATDEVEQFAAIHVPQGMGWLHFRVEGPEPGDFSACSAYVEPAEERAPRPCNLPLLQALADATFGSVRPLEQVSEVLSGLACDPLSVDRRREGNLMTLPTLLLLALILATEWGLRRRWRLR